MLCKGAMSFLNAFAKQFAAGQQLRIRPFNGAAYGFGKIRIYFFTCH